MNRSDIHPLAYWLWALGMILALAKIADFYAAVVLVVAAAVVVRFCAEDSPWRSAFRKALYVAAIVMAIRLFIGVTLTVPMPGHVLVTLPRLQLPGWFAGINVGGAVTRERLSSALNEGSVIAGVIVLVGAAVSLSQPRRLLRLLPGALHEAGVAVVIATTFVPQLISSIQRVREARHLRGREISGMAGWRGIAIPVLEDALERATALAMAMESRGYGRVMTGSRRLSNQFLMLSGLVAMMIGAFGLVTSGSQKDFYLLIGGSVVAGVSLWAAGQRKARTSLQVDEWNLRSVLFPIAGLAVCTAAYLGVPHLALVAASLPAVPTGGAR